MPEFNSKAFGKLTYSDDGRMHFPVGLFGFEKEQWFLLIEQPGTRPLLFLQSLSTPELCFVTLRFWRWIPVTRCALVRKTHRCWVYPQIAVR